MNDGPPPALRDALGHTTAIHQLLPTFVPGDAIGYNVVALQDLFRSWGFEAEVFARDIDPALRHRARPSHEFPAFDRERTAVVLHYGIHCAELELFVRARGRRVLLYHNITPAHFFLHHHLRTYYFTKLGRYQLPQAVRAAHLVLGDSPFTCEELEKLGAARCHVLPLFTNIESLAATPASRAVLDAHRDGVVNVLFVGRIAPNKRQDLLIRAFAQYQRTVNPTSRLLLVGHAMIEGYQRELEQLVDELGVRSVVFTGGVPVDELVAYYRVADVFVCLSTHEGFCNPLLEAMRFDVPVLAAFQPAVSQTMGAAGVLLPDVEPVTVAAMIDRAVRDREWRADVLARQRRRLDDFAPAKVASVLAGYLGALLQ